VLTYHHLLSTDDTPRCLVDVEINVNDKIFHLLEVDTSDGKKSMSSQLLLLDNHEVWNTNLKELESQLISSHLRWPSEMIARICSQQGTERISHPKSQHEDKGVLDPNSIKGWADKIFLMITRGC
jgi:hypothetical protein